MAYDRKGHQGVNSTRQSGSAVAQRMTPQTRSWLLRGTNLNTPVSGMRSFWGLMGAYWRSSEWKTAYALAAGIVILTAALSKGSVYVAEYTANFMAAILSLAPGSPASDAPGLKESAGFLAAAITARAAVEASRHLLSTTLHRKWRGWLNEQFTRALLKNRSYVHLLHSQNYDPDNPEAMPENIDQRIQEAPKVMTGGAIGLSMGLWGIATSIFFIGQKLMEKSTPVEGLGFLGAYAGITLAFGAAAAYVPLNTYIAIRIGRYMERFNILCQQAEATYRGNLNAFLRNTQQIAAARGERVQKKIADGLYEDIDAVWGKQNIVSTVFLGFNNVQSGLQNKLVSYLPAFPAFEQGHLSLTDYLTSSELVSHLISDCSWLINVMPDIANLRAYANRLTGVAVAMERVHDAKSFYARSGVAEINFYPEEDSNVISAKKLEIFHTGSSKPFLRVNKLSFERGKWAAVMGASGSGKSTMVKALVDLWPYGRGDVRFPRRSRLIFASQEPFIPRASLKQCLCLPHDEGRYGDAEIAALMEEVGLGDFSANLGDALYNGKPWDNVLSGGQKQLAVLARVLLHKPDILVMDEATSALDENSKLVFHALLKKHCPDLIVISIIHDKSLLNIDPETGTGFYDSVVMVRDGMAVQSHLRPPPRLPHRPKAALTPF